MASTKSFREDRALIQIRKVKRYMNPGWRKRCLRLLSLISGNLRLQSSATTYSQSFHRFPESNYPRSQQTSNHRRLGLFDFSIRCHSCSSTFFEWSFFFLFLFSQINKKGNLLQRYPGAVTTHLSFRIPPSFRLPPSRLRLWTES